STRRWRRAWRPRWPTPPAATGSAADVTAPGFDAVTFDFWNTLCVTDNERYRAERLHVTRELLAREGVACTDDEIESALRHVFEVFNQAWADQRQFTASDAVDVLVERVAPSLPEAARIELSELY